MTSGPEGTLAHVAYVTALRDECERVVHVLRDVDPAAPVPSCSGWSAGDLMAHLAEVQHVWAQVVGAGLTWEEIETPERPADGDLLGAVARSGTELAQALAGRSPQEPCWSWHEDGGSVGWVARRQAHEALVHRVDAELTAGVPVTPPSVDLAADGVDEVLRVMVDGVPAWGEFTPDGTTVLLRCDNAPRAWTLALGRFTGTGPDSGTAYDLDAAAHLAEDDGGTDDLTVVGPAWALDRWLWGRGGTDELVVRGEPALVERVRALLSEATQ